MAIKDYFKAKPEPERERSLMDPEQILAWLEELARIRTVMDLRFGSADQPIIAAKVELVGEETRTCTFCRTLQDRGPDRSLYRYGGRIHPRSAGPHDRYRCRGRDGGTGSTTALFKISYPYHGSLEP